MGRKQQRNERARVRESRRGITMVELMIAAMVFTIAAGGISAVMASSFALNRANRERAMAIAVAEDVLEGMHAASFSEVFALYNADPGDDPGGVGSAPGRTFDVAGLRPQIGDPDGAIGEVIFPGGGLILREDLPHRLLGMPRDLNGDGAWDFADHSLDYTVLPVGVRLRWTGSGGAQTAIFVTTLSDH